jgi:hypothetical protein
VIITYVPELSLWLVNISRASAVTP